MNNGMIEAMMGFAGGLILFVPVFVVIAAALRNSNDRAAVLRAARLQELKYTLRPLDLQ